MVLRHHVRLRWIPKLVMQTLLWMCHIRFHTAAYVCGHVVEMMGRGQPEALVDLLALFAKKH